MFWLKLIEDTSFLSQLVHKFMHQHYPMHFTFSKDYRECNVYLIISFYLVLPCDLSDLNRVYSFWKSM